MPLTEKERSTLKRIKRFYRRKGYSKKRAEHIANAVVYGGKKKREDG